MEWNGRLNNQTPRALDQTLGQEGLPTSKGGMTNSTASASEM